MCIRDRLRIVGHLQQRMKMKNHQRVNVVELMELVDETFYSRRMNNRDVVPVWHQVDKQCTSMNFPLSEEHRQQVIAVFRYEEHVEGSQVLGSSEGISGAMPNWWTVHIGVFCYQRNIFIRSNSWCDVREMCSVRRKVFCSRWNIFIKTVCLLTKQDVIVSTITTATFSASVYFDDLLHFLQLQPDQRTFVIFPFILPEVVYICTSASTMCFVSW